MAHDTFGNRRWPSDGYDPTEGYGRSVREEYEHMRRRLDELSRELDYFRSAAHKSETERNIYAEEVKSCRKFVRILELALHLAIQDDVKKAELLATAQKSIEVLKTFEK